MITKNIQMHITRCSANKSDPHVNTQFEIHEMGSLSRELHESETLLIFQDTYVMIWIQEGHGEIAIDLEKYGIEAQTIYYARPRQAIACHVTAPLRGFVIQFEKDFLDLFDKNSSELSTSILFNHFFSIPVIKIDDETSVFFENIALEMFREFRRFLSLRSEILKGLLKIFIFYLSRNLKISYEHNCQCRKTELVRTFYTLIENNYTTKKLVREYAEIMAVSPGYLNETVKELSGFSASHHIQHRLLLEAKRRAVYEGHSLKEISYYLGFWDPSHFSKFFKNIAGTNFSDFKKGISNC